MTLKPVYAHIVAITFCIFSSGCFAYEYHIVATGALKHSDNVLLSNTQPQSDVERRTELNLTLEQKSPSIESTIDYQILRSDYEKKLRNTETVIEGQAALKWTPLPQNFNWNFFTSTHNLQRDNRELDLLDNQERRTIVSTGPQFGARIGNVNTVQMAGRYTTTELEESDQNNNERVSANVEWIHRLSPTRELTTGLETSNTDFEQNTQADIENNSAYISFNSRLSSSSLRAKAGYNNSKYGNNDKVGGPLLEMFMEYMPANQRLSFLVVNLITDSTIGLGNNPTINAEGINTNDSNFTNVDIVKRLYSQLRYSNETFCNSCTVSTAIIYDHQDFDTLLFDETTTEGEIDFLYRVNSLLNVGVTLALESIEFHDESRTDDIESIQVHSQYSITHSMAIYARLGLDKRKSTATETQYDEFSGEIGFRYRLH